MGILEDAYSQLYPEKAFPYDTVEIVYSRKFRPYNANVRLRGKNLVFHFSHEWKDVSEEIQIGLIQELFVKLAKDKRKTTNIELYNIFVKNLHVAAPKTESEPEIEESFERVNDKYFSGMLDKPNLRWGINSFRKLGHYEYTTDTIVISTIFRGAEHELIDIIMYHEMLHKKLKFYQTNGRNMHHSPEFREMEKMFENFDSVEKKLHEFVRYKKRSRWFLFRGF